MCSGSRSPSPYKRRQSPQPNAKDSGGMMGRVDNTQKPYRDQLPSAPTRGMQFKQDAAADILELANSERTNQKQSESEPKSRTINTTIKPGTTVRGQQRTESAAPSRRRIKSARMGRRSGTNSLRIARGSNTGSGNLNY